MRAAAAKSSHLYVVSNGSPFWDHHRGAPSVGFSPAPAKESQHADRTPEWMWSPWQDQTFVRSELQGCDVKSKLLTLARSRLHDAAVNEAAAQMWQ